MTKTELVATLASDVLITSADDLAAELLETSSECHYFEALEEAFDIVVAELTARGLWYGEES